MICYHHLEQGIFLERPNRFIAKVLIRNTVETVHVKNTGRCKELLIPGISVWLEKTENSNRKTQYDLIAVRKENGIFINFDSQLPNDLVDEWIRSGRFLPKIKKIQREVTFGNSRFDFYLETDTKKIFLEVKGCTLEQDHIARFPDAPTERGVKHLQELMQCIDKGYEAYIVFVLTMKGCILFEPNLETHRLFGETLKKAKDYGVHILAVDCQTAPDSVIIDQQIPIRV